MSDIPDSFKKKIDINNKKQTKKENCIVNRKNPIGKIFKKPKKNQKKYLKNQKKTKTKKIHVVIENVNLVIYRMESFLVILRNP